MRQREIPKTGSRQRKRKTGITFLNDEEKDKKFPNGLQATMNAIRHSWPDYEDRGASRTPHQFAQISEFFEVCNKNLKRYGGTPKSARALGKTIGRLDGYEKPAGGVHFPQLRAYAEYIGLPTGLFLLFTQAVSYEAQGRDKDAISAFLTSAQEALNVLDYWFRKSKEPYFHYAEGDAEVAYRAKLVGLDILRTTFRMQKIRKTPRAPSDDGAPLSAG